MKHYYFYTLKALWDSQGKALGCIMGCPGLKSSYQKKVYYDVIYWNLY